MSVLYSDLGYIELSKNHFKIKSSQQTQVIFNKFQTFKTSKEFESVAGGWMDGWMDG